MTIKIYTTDGEKIFLENIEWSELKKEIKKKNYDGTYTLKNGDLVEIR
jgi:protein involved in polysaccharide export with SLBB domain